MFSRRGFNVRLTLLRAVLALGLATSSSAITHAASSEDQAILQVDHQFVQAVNGGSGLAGLLDSDFTWTDSTGATKSHADVLKSVPQPALGDEKDATTKQMTYAQVGAVIVGRDKIQVLRIWVKRPAGWRLLVYHEVKLSDQ